MSWQFNDSIGPQTAIGTTSNPQLSAIDSISKGDHVTTLTTAANSISSNNNNNNNNNDDMATNMLPSTEGHLGRSGNQEQRQQHLIGRIELAQQQHQDHEFFQKLLHHQDQDGQQQLFSNMYQDPHNHHLNSMKNISPNGGINNNNNSTTNNSIAANDANTSILGDASSSSSLIDHLLPEQSSLPWSTYSMPIYSSFGVDMNYSSDGEAAIMGDKQINNNNSSSHLNNNSITNNNNNNNTSKILSIGSNLIDRLNQSNSDNNAIFLAASSSAGNANLNGASAGGGVGSRLNSRQSDEIMGTGRSYSSVLHSTHDPQQGRSPIFATHNHHQPPPVTSNQNDSSALLVAPSSLIPTNQRQTPSQYHHHNHQQQQQARQMNEFISYQSQFSQQSYQRQYQPHPFNANSNPSVAAPNVGTTSGSYFPRSVNINNNNSNIEKNIGIGGGGLPVGPNVLATGNKRRNKLPFFTNSANVMGDNNNQKVDIYGSALVNSDGSERFSRKVFVGGLPPDIDEEEIKASFRRFGTLVVDWPHKAESKSYFPPKGYAFLLFHEESSVQALIDTCLQEEDKLYLCVSSPTIKDKPVQIRPWRLSDADFVLDSTLALDPRKTVFVGGVPRPLKASELANIMNNLYGGVCYAGIDTDPELKYPKGAGRVAFSSHQSYIAAISARYVHLHHSEIEKRVEVKPYVLDDQFCDECQGARCGNKFAPFFCANITCLQYYCENCWTTVHSQQGREFHKPLVKEGADRPRGLPLRWG